MINEAPKDTAMVHRFLTIVAIVGIFLLCFSSANSTQICFFQINHNAKGQPGCSADSFDIVNDPSFRSFLEELFVACNLSEIIGSLDPYSRNLERIQLVSDSTPPLSLAVRCNISCQFRVVIDKIARAFFTVRFFFGHRRRVALSGSDIDWRGLVAPIFSKANWSKENIFVVIAHSTDDMMSHHFIRDRDHMRFISIDDVNEPIAKYPAVEDTRTLLTMRNTFRVFGKTSLVTISQQRILSLLKTNPKKLPGVPCAIDADGTEAGGAIDAKKRNEIMANKNAFLAGEVTIIRRRCNCRTS